jgi:hypothetical protein
VNQEATFQPSSPPKELSVGSPDDIKGNNIVSPDETLTFNVTNKEPTTTDPNLMEITGKIKTKKTTLPEEMDVKVTVYPKDKSAPIIVPQENVSSNNNSSAFHD